MSRSTVHTLADEELVRLALAGDKTAFAEAVRRHERTARSLTTRLLGDADLAGDAVQEAIVVALVGLDRLRTPQRFGPWLCGIALNIARRWAQRANRTWPGDPPAPVAGPEAEAETNDLAARVRSAVGELSPARRDAVLLFYLQGLTHREVADELAISVGTVKSRLNAARRALAPELIPLVEPAPAPPEDTTMTDPTDRDTSAGGTGDRATADAASSHGEGEGGRWADATVVSILRGPNGSDPRDAAHVVVLREVGGEGELAIWVGAPEANFLALTVESVEMPRPMTFQLTSDLLGAAGGRVREVRITRLSGEVFYATVAVDGPAGTVEVDARPSDALNLAAIADAPIRVHAELFTAAPHRRLDWRTFTTDAAALADELTARRDRHLADLGADLGADPAVDATDR
ncbi:MAG: bifunctional nuclease domain-containing protein [Actinomycetota bacterium]|nr:bifunctional nuclease domain-containing protein [Actinomycetota bacterium]